MNNQKKWNTAKKGAGWDTNVGRQAIIAMLFGTCYRLRFRIRQTVLSDVQLICRGKRTLNSLTRKKNREMIKKWIPIQKYSSTTVYNSIIIYNRIYYNLYEY